MPDRPEAAITTLLFTDLVDSTELVQQVGDEQAQRIFEAHHGTLVDCLGAHGGEELQWEGDGLMAASASKGTPRVHALIGTLPGRSIRS